MLIQEECIGCIINQSRRVADAIKANAVLANALTSKVQELSKEFSFEQSPPEIAADVYEMMAEMAQMEDLYAEIKDISTQKALTFIPHLKEKLSTCHNKLYTATKIAVAGNVIDLAAQVEFDLNAELAQIFDTDFAHDDFAQLEEKLSHAKSVLIIGDNVGEHIFDYLYIETLKELYLNCEFYYMVRGNPIINDVTIKEAKAAGFDTLCHLVDSGVNTPGFAYNRANKASQELFDSVDLVITKGMGNYECLSNTHRKNLCFLLKVKCEVVARSLGQNLGDIICKMV
jgi:uncharacterized protein with ATP-grasp and redox domains